MIDNLGLPGQATNVVYWPPPGLSLIDTFEYTFTDANGQTVSGTVTIEMMPEGL